MAARSALVAERVRVVLDDFRRWKPRELTRQAVAAYLRRAWSLTEEERTEVLHAIFRRGEQMARHGAKSYEQTSKGAKVTYPRWRYAVGLMEQLRERMSVTELSRAVKGHGATPNWAAAAMEYREQVTERDIRKLEEVAGVPKAGKKGIKKGSKLLKEGQKGKLARVLHRLRTEYGWTNALLGDALGMKAPSVSRLIAKGGGSADTLRRARQILEWMEAPSPHPNGKEKGTSEPETTLAQDGAEQPTSADAIPLPFSPYHAFAVNRLAEVMGSTPTEVLRQIVWEWGITRQDYLKGAGADLTAYREREQ